MGSYKAVYSKRLSGIESRYIVIDTETGEILDDAQGYGFKTKQKACACYAYKKNNGTEKKSKKYSKKETKAFIQRWIKRNQDFVDTFHDDYLYYWKGNGQTEPTNKEIENYFKEAGYEDIPFSIEDFLKYS